MPHPKQGGLVACLDAGRVVLFLPAKLSLAQSTVALFRNVLRTLFSNGVKDLVCDLSVCSHIDSSGIAELVVAFTFCSDQGGSFALNRVSGTVNDLLTITKLHKVFRLSEVDYSERPTFQVSPDDIVPLQKARANA